MKKGLCGLFIAIVFFSLLLVPKSYAHSNMGHKQGHYMAHPSSMHKPPMKHKSFIGFDWNYNYGYNPMGMCYYQYGWGANFPPRLVCPRNNIGIHISI